MNRDEMEMAESAMKKILNRALQFVEALSVSDRLVSLPMWLNHGIGEWQRWRTLWLPPGT